MRRVTILVVALLVATLPALGQAPGAARGEEEALWRDFAAWVGQLTPAPESAGAFIRARYVEHLVATGVSREEALRRFSVIDAYRRGSVERERIYWDGLFKLRGGPNQPLRLLQEVVRGAKPGVALDVAMGSGRNSIFLASIGWQVTGYDMSQPALDAAKAAAAKAGTAITTVNATHDAFEFGEARWDLIVISYAYVDPSDPAWPARLQRALKPGGLIVMQETVRPGATAASVVANWSAFRVLRFEQPEASSEDWLPNQPYLRLVLRKQ